MNIPLLGLILQAVFFLCITIFNFVRVNIMENFSVYPVAFFELLLGVISLICGIIGIVKKTNVGLSIIVMFIGIFICFYFVFIYLLGEAGSPPPIRWFYK